MKLSVIIVQPNVSFLFEITIYKNPEIARSFLLPMVNHLQDACIGSISEIFDGDPPFTPRGCFAQAWSVAEVLRSWLMVHN